MSWTLKDVTKNIDITPYLSEMTWSGDMNSAARKLEFKIAYTTTAKDANWKNIVLDVGDRVEMCQVDDLTKNTLRLFNGVIFLQNRASESYTMEFCAFDNIIYLAKSKMSVKFDNALPQDCIQQVCNTLGVTTGDLAKCADLSNAQYKYSNVFDSQAGCEIIQEVLKHLTSWTGYRYHAYMAADANGKQRLNVSREDQTIESFKIAAETNLISAHHGRSIENMVNQVTIKDKDGNVTGYIKNDADIAKYGLLQDVYTVDDKKNTQTAAKALLKKVAENSSIEAIGNVQCISGWAVEVQEEQIKGKFLIASDSHKIDNNGNHTMSLDLTYIMPPDDSKDAKQEGYIPSSSLPAGTSGSTIDAGLKAGAAAWVGQTMDNGTNGCAEAVGKVGSYYSPFLKQECQNGVVSVPDMVSDAGSNCIPFDASKVEKGDTIVYGDNDHVVIAAGPSGDYIGNSSSQNKVIHGSDFYEMGGLYPTKIIKTSHI